MLERQRAHSRPSGGHILRAERSLQYAIGCCKQVLDVLTVWPRISGIAVEIRIRSSENTAAMPRNHEKGTIALGSRSDQGVTSGDRWNQDMRSFCEAHSC